VIAAD